MNIETRLALTESTLRYATTQLQLIADYVNKVDAHHIKAVALESIKAIKDNQDFCNSAEHTSSNDTADSKEI